MPRSCRGLAVVEAATGELSETVGHTGRIWAGVCACERTNERPFFLAEGGSMAAVDGCYSGGVVATAVVVFTHAAASVLLSARNARCRVEYIEEVFTHSQSADQSTPSRILPMQMKDKRIVVVSM